MSLSAPQVVYVFAAVLFAAFFRGYSGFGFSLAAVPTLSVVLDPAEAVPVSLLLEIVLTLRFLSQIRHSITWRPVCWLLAGAAVGTPVGVYALSAVPPQAMRFALGAILLGSVALLWRRPELAWQPGRPATLVTGAVSGVLSGGTAMSGPPIVLFFLSIPASAAVGRASMMAYFLFSALLAAVMDACAGLYSGHILVLALLVCPPLLIGSTLGARCFVDSKALTYRQVSLLMLAGIGVFAIGCAVVATVPS